MTLSPPIEPMLAEARRELPPDRALPGHLVAEQKPDGFRAVLFARGDRVMLQSRNGADLTDAFPEIAAAASALEEDLVLDGELVVPYEGRLLRPVPEPRPSAGPWRGGGRRRAPRLPHSFRRLGGRGGRAAGPVVPGAPGGQLPAP
ncbi:ATP-dependent DNA ligase [Streptomyces sp. NPDC002920]